MNVVGKLRWRYKFKFVVVTCWNIKLDMSVVGSDVVNRLRQLI